WLYYSDEGIEFAQWGVEGETYTRAEDGTRTLLDDIGWNALNPDAARKLNTDFGYSNGVFLLANGSSLELLQSVMTEEIATWTEEVLASKEIMPVAPAARLDEMELETTSLLDSQLRDAVQAATAAFITGQRPLSDWDAYVAEMEGLGATQLVDTYNAALARQGRPAAGRVPRAPDRWPAPGRHARMTAVARSGEARGATPVGQVGEVGRGPLSRGAAWVYRFAVLEVLLVLACLPGLVVALLLDRHPSNLPLAVLALAPV